MNRVLSAAHQVALDDGETMIDTNIKGSHVNINTVQMMPLCLAFAAFAVKRD